MTPVNRSESLFSVRIPVRRCTPLVMHYDFLENRSRPWHVTHDVHEHSARRREKRKREREKNEGNRFRRSWWNSCPWHWTHCGMRVHFRSRSSATWSRRCRGQLRTFKVRKKRGKRRYRYFLHAQRGEKHRRRQHPDICQPTGFSPWIYRPFSLSLSLPSVSISFQTLHTWPASLSLSLDIVIAIPSTHQRRSKFLGQLLGSSIPRENFAKFYAITREEREIFSTLSQEYLRFETDSEVLPIYRHDPSHDKKKNPFYFFPLFRERMPFSREEKNIVLTRRVASRKRARKPVYLAWIQEQMDRIPRSTCLYNPFPPLLRR